MTSHQAIAESNNFIILSKLERSYSIDGSYQSEAQLESQLIKDLQQQGYEYLANIKTYEDMLANVRLQLQSLNQLTFNDNEWQRFVTEYLDKPSEGHLEKSAKVHHDHIHDFSFDDGRRANIYLFDKDNISRNKLQVIKQFEQQGTRLNRYDVTILVNGLPMVQIELKRRGVAIQQAFNQVNRYSLESFNSENSLYKYLQLFVISNGTYTRYFANTTKRNKNSYDFTIEWALANNQAIKDLQHFTASFFQKNTLLNVLLRYAVFDSTQTLLVMRPYQIAATERILWKIQSAYHAKNWSKPESGGYIWHTTGSGKTLTSFKAARLATQLDFIDKVFFVVDRKDLDYQTMKEYQSFARDSVDGSRNTAQLKKNIQKLNDKIIVTTIQKLNNLLKDDEKLAIYEQQVVFIFDECHRSQFGEAQRNIKRKFKKFYQFGFTGTPIFGDQRDEQGALIRRGNALDNHNTTVKVFGECLHTYVITDAINDQKVLRFNIDYNDVRPQFKAIEREQDEQKLSAHESNAAFLHPLRIKEITEYILANYRHKTARQKLGQQGFNAMFAVASVDAARLYYEEFKRQQEDVENPLTVATIYSYAANEDLEAVGQLPDEGFNTTRLQSSDKEFLSDVIADYNAQFKTNYSIDGRSFEDYYKDVAKRVRERDIDLLIVVGMFLTGFDAPTLNTLFVDKNLRYHGLIQAFSRTNRIYNSTKAFGNIVTFRDLEQNTIDALVLFGDKNAKNIVLERSFDEYMFGFEDPLTGDASPGLAEVIKQLTAQFPEPTNIILEKEKKRFVELFGSYLRIENILRNYDEFVALKDWQTIDVDNPDAVAQFREEHFLSEESFARIQSVTVSLPSEREVQDYLSTYNDIRQWFARQKEGELSGEGEVDWDEVVFEVDLLKSQEIDLDYILGLLLAHNQQHQDKQAVIEEARRLISANFSVRAKETLLVHFIEQVDLNGLTEKEDIIEAFYHFAQAEQKRDVRELIQEEDLNEPAAKRYILNSLRRGYASESGTELNQVMPRMSPLNPLYLATKTRIHTKVQQLVETYHGAGGDL